MSQIVPTSSHAQNLTGQTVNYFGPVLKGADFLVPSRCQWTMSGQRDYSLTHLGMPLYFHEGCPRVETSTADMPAWEHSVILTSHR
jgi:hypothetical protein